MPREVFRVERKQEIRGDKYLRFSIALYLYNNTASKFFNTLNFQLFHAIMLHPVRLNCFRFVC